jgi:hypothetical protein
MKYDARAAAPNLVVHAMIGGEDVRGPSIAVVLLKHLVEPLHAMINDIDVLQIPVHAAINRIMGQPMRIWHNWRADATNSEEYGRWA